MKIEENFYIKTLDQITSLQQQETLSLIEESFKYPKEHHYNVDFYPLFNKDNFENCFALINRQSEEVVGHVGVKKQLMVLHNNQVKTAFIGGIAIKSDYEGQGLFKYLFNYVLEECDTHSDLQFLWSDKTELYNKFNFFEVGKVFIYGEGANIEDVDHGFEEIEIADLDMEDILSINKLYNNRYGDCFRPRRNIFKWKDYQGVTSTRVFIKKVDDEIIEYFLYGKGADLTDIIFEESGVNVPNVQTWTPYSEGDQSSEIFLSFVRVRPGFEIEINAPIYISGLDSI